ncbi:hypothetical protein LTR37_001006 [Vermiconidia calcicola]|uniref:Uncharacterized protein n=1 Tax=Vermiconidia calcicola TaxID=1690605 RepID=A0ACC3NW83_9PEZI|nr:hypothetical protein LTR37_001006 [Vermiconidia calcicola]
MFSLADKDATAQTINGVTWTVPQGVLITGLDNAESSYETWTDGSKAASDFKINTSLAAKYWAVSVDASVSYSVDRSLTLSKQYAFFSFNQDVLLVQLPNWSKHIDSDSISAQASMLEPWDPKTPDTVQDYKNYLDEFGTHIITGMKYGGRLQITAWAENSDSSTTQNFAADVDAKYEGIQSNGQFDISISDSGQYKAFSASATNICSCKGGDPTLSAKLSNPAHHASAVDPWDLYQQWILTSRTNPEVMSLALTPIWEIVGFVDRKVAKDVYHAYTYLTVTKPPVCITHCTLVVESDWGEIALQTPSATLAPDPKNAVDPMYKDNLQTSTTKWQFGKEYSHDYKRAVVIPFIVENDGSPIILELSHGSLAGDGSSDGKVTVNVDTGPNTNAYVNDTKPDNVWNSKIFMRVPVNPVPSA